jgi:hypothetical protein
MAELVEIGGAPDVPSRAALDLRVEGALTMRPSQLAHVAPVGALASAYLRRNKRP